MNKLLKIEFARIYELYLNKIIAKLRTKEELDEVLEWLSGYKSEEIRRAIDTKMNLQEFCNYFPQINPKAYLIKGTICGYRIEEIGDPIMKRIRYMDKLVDELAKGKSLEKIRRER